MHPHRDRLDARRAGRCPPQDQCSRRSRRWPSRRRTTSSSTRPSRGARRRSLPTTRSKFNAMKSRWEAEKNGVDERQEAQEPRSSRLHGDIEQRAGCTYEYEKAAKLKIPTCPALEKQLAGRREATSREAHSDNYHGARHRDRGTRSPTSSASGRASPSAKLMEGEREKLPAPRRDHPQARRRSGRGRAASSTEAIHRSRAGIADPNRPIGTLPLPRSHRASARRSLQRPSPTACSTTSTTSCAST